MQVTLQTLRLSKIENGGKCSRRDKFVSVVLLMGTHVYKYPYKQVLVITLLFTWERATYPRSHLARYQNLFP